MDAYPTIAGIHHRMPVMLDRAAWDAWLDPATSDAVRLREALRPLPEAAVAAHAVGRAVNSPVNDGPDLVRPEEAAAAPVQGALF
jgi:putative SOS response-associated peptidase YedK